MVRPLKDNARFIAVNLKEPDKAALAASC